MGKQKRKYIKKSSYWDQFDKESSGMTSPRDVLAVQNNFEPALIGEPFYNEKQLSTASRSSSDATTTSPTRQNRAAFGNATKKYKNIENGVLPWTVGKDCVDVKTAVELCQKAYFNLGVFRNTVDAMSELADSELYLEDGSRKSRDFFNAWLDKIDIKALKRQFFREYYRSGNIFLYRLDGTLKKNYVEGVPPSAISVKSDVEMPLKYILLNPATILISNSADFTDPTYVKALSKYELSVLKNPKTDKDKKLFDSFDAEIKKKIKKGDFMNTGVDVKLDPEFLHTVFYKKMDYEPFAMPFGFPVLEDLNTKLEFKKVDRAICRTIENVVLLMTMGAEPEKGGVNPVAMNRMQELFKNESVGRVLVSDYTTKGEFLIPDLKKVIYKEKYDILNRDIQDGLQNILVSDEKFSNIQIKVDVFVERLGEARDTFLNDFLQPEIDRVSEALGFRFSPKALFKEIDIKDSTDLMRVSTRLVELGILTPEQAMDLFHTGKFPDSEDLVTAQEEYRKSREKGYYNPLVGGVPTGPEVKQEMKMKEEGLKNQKEAVNSNPDGPTAVVQKEKTAPKAAGRPNAEVQQKTKAYHRDDVKDVVKKTSSLIDVIEDLFKSKYKTKKLSGDQMCLVESLSESIITAKSPEEWESTAKGCVKDFNEIEKLKMLPEINDVAIELDIDFYSAALLYHSNGI